MKIEPLSTLKSSAESFYKKAKLISMGFCQFPSYIDSSLKSDINLFSLLKAVNKPEITSDERGDVQHKLKTIVFELLDHCLYSDPEYSPAFLLYAKVASWNPSPTDKPHLVGIFERLLGDVEHIQKGSRGYTLVEKDIEGYVGGNFFNQVERHLADFYFDFGNLYLSEKRYSEAIVQFKKAIKLMPLLGHLYCGLSDAYVGNKEYVEALSLWERVRDVPLHEITDREAFIRPKYEAVISEIQRAHRFRLIAEQVIPFIERNPNTLQKDLYKTFVSSDKKEISLLLWSMDAAGLIRRTKRGSSYQLCLEKPADEILKALDRVSLP
jgi:tetratricopeptide (TPR) repeat protein